MSHQTKRPFDSVECSTPHDLLIRCSLSNLQFPAIALTWCGLTSHRHRSIEPFFMSLAARDSEFRRWSGRVDRRICQTFAASPAEPGELPLGFSLSLDCCIVVRSDSSQSRRSRNVRVISADPQDYTITSSARPSSVSGKLIPCARRSPRFWSVARNLGAARFRGSARLHRPRGRWRDLPPVMAPVGDCHHWRVLA
jgi:hypothetical protein